MSSLATGGPEQQVNSFTNGYRTASSVSVLSDGSWIVAWASNGQDGSGMGIYQQRFAADGTLLGVGNDFLDSRVNLTTSDDQMAPVTTALAGGGWLVAWVSYDAGSEDGAGIRLQRFNASGQMLGQQDIQINDFKTGDQVNVGLVALNDGGFVVSWQTPSNVGGDFDVVQKRFNASGTALWSDSVVSLTDQNQYAPKMASLVDGGWVVSYAADLDGDGTGVYLERYNTAGSRVGGAVRVNSQTEGVQANQVVTGLSDGGWVVAWDSSTQDSGGYGVFMQRFDASGAKIGGEVQVNTFSPTNQYAPAIAELAGGGWVVAWTSMGQDGSDSGVYQQRYDANGNKVGTETLVNVTTSHDQHSPSIAAFADGSWIVSYTSGGGDMNPDPYVILQRRFSPDIVGDETNNSLVGTNFDETLFGLGGNDTLDGKGGNDVLIGGYGDDLYYVNSAGDDVQEQADQGNDTVITSISYSIAFKPGLENITLTGNAVVATGNSLANVLTGNAVGNVLTGGDGDDRLYGEAGTDQLSGDTGNDVLDGGADADTMTGGAGDDTYFYTAGDKIVEDIGGGVDTVSSAVSVVLASNVEKLVLTGTGNVNGTGNSGANTLTGNAGANILNGGAGNDVLSGGAGNDRLIGGLGVDIMYGGAGNDIYYVDQSTDKASESGGSGIDTVLSSASKYTIASGIERLTLTGSGNISGTGNTAANILTGNTGRNTLSGAAGNDAISGGAGNDLLLGGTGNDILKGDAGNDTLDGGSGKDTMYGGAGSDTFYVTAGDKVIEKTNGGIDAVKSAISFTLSANVEKLTLSGASNVNGTGNGLANVITGNNGNNKLYGLSGDDNLAGGKGNDVLDGGAGKDQLTGGVGVDTFVFKTAYGADTIKDFDAQDRIDIRAWSAISDYKDLVDNHLTFKGGNAIIQYGQDVLTIIGVTEDDLTANDFLF